MKTTNHSCWLLERYVTNLPTYNYLNEPTVTNCSGLKICLFFCLSELHLLRKSTFFFFFPEHTEAKWISLRIPTICSLKGIPLRQSFGPNMLAVKQYLMFPLAPEAGLDCSDCLPSF